MNAPVAGSAQPLIGVVVPVFRHSGLVVDALASLLDQVAAPAFAVALVNDGCPYRETDLVCLGFARSVAAPPIHYLKRRNGGLSAARNTGINFLLRRYPSLQAIYFLDADNRLRSHALARMAEALREHGSADWFYPDIDMFGMSVVAQYGGDYSPLLHTATNISEAGSLVRRRVFERGLLFDEDMRHGFEDWDFWLGAREQGFVGRHLPHMGFNYRKRPESMLAESARDEADIKAYMRRKRKTLFQLRNLLTLEAAEAPRYAIVLDSARVALTLDPRDLAATVSVEEFIALFWRWWLRPDVHFTPPFLVFLSTACWEVLDRSRVLPWVFWDLELRLRDSNFAATRLGRCDHDGAKIGPASRLPTRLANDVHVVMTSADFARDLCADCSGSEWLDGVMTGGVENGTSLRAVGLNDNRLESLTPRAAMAGAYSTLLALYGAPFRQAGKTTWRWAQSGVPDRHSAYKVVRAAANQGVVLPVKPDGRRHIGFVLSYADFGGVEKVAVNVAKVLRARGFVPHLVLMQVGSIRLPPAVGEVFESLLWVTADGMLRWTGDHYNGTRLSWWSQHGERTDAVGLLAWLDAVINCQSADAHGLMGDLRRRGVLTLTHQHLVEVSRAGRPGGSATIAKAFEYSYAKILTASRDLRHWFIANGIPAAKLMAVDNAPAYEVEPRAVAAMVEERIGRTLAGDALRVVFMGRFDVQKGLDRLLAIIEGTAATPIRWRVVGKAIVDADPLVKQLEVLVEIEPPVYTDDEVTALYRWADVVVLPSRYEGVPLTILEAMRCGVVVVAADAGAVAEVIDNERTGFIVPQRNCVPDMIAVLGRLSAEPELKQAISSAALRSSTSRTWDRSLVELGDYLDGHFATSLGEE